MIIRVKDINTDPGCSVAIDPDMALGHSLGLYGSTGQSVRHGLSDAHMDSGGSLNPGICTAFSGY